MKIRLLIALSCTLVLIASISCGGAGSGSPSLPSLESVGPQNSGFKVDINGFNFANYGNSVCGQSAANLTSESVVKMCGTGVCSSPVQADGSCQLLATAQVWMDRTNELLGKGRCAGFAALSMEFLQGNPKVSSYGSQVSQAYDLAMCTPINIDLQKELATQSAYQFITNFQQLILWPRDAKEFLTRVGLGLEGLRKGTATSSAYYIGIFQNGLTKGHAVTPIETQDMGNGTWNIVVYDNNFPGAKQNMTVDTQNNTVKFIGSTRPGTQVYTYDSRVRVKDGGGTVALFPVTFRPNLTCPFAGRVGSTVGSLQVTSAGSGGALVQISASGGRTLAAGVDTFPGETGYALGIVGDDALQSDVQSFVAPEQTKLDIKLDCSVLKDSAGSNQFPESISVFGDGGYSLEADSIKCATGEVHTITVAEKGNEITYSSSVPETLAEHLSFTGVDGIGYIFDAYARTDTTGAVVNLKNDLQGGQISFMLGNNDAKNGSYSIIISRIDGNKNEVFNNCNEKSVSAGDIVVFYYSQWGGDGKPMKVDTIKSDGTVITEELPDNTSCSKWWDD